MYRKENLEMTRYRGLATDTKPDADFGSTFHEMDTGDIYRFDGSEWQKCGSLAGTDPSIYMSMWGARGNTKKAWALSALAGGHSDPGILKTVTGNPISVSDALAARIQSLSVSLSPIQAGSGDPSPDNVRPISGRTAVTVWREASYDPSADPAFTIQLGQTVYGGTLDVTNGKLTVNWAKIVLNGTQQISRENWKPQANSVGWIYPYNLTRNVVGTGAVKQNIKCDTLPSMPFNSLQSINGPGIALASNQTYGISVMYPNTTLTTASAINAFLAEHPIDVVYELAEPFDIDLTPAQLTALKGDNTVWSDGDDISMTYKAAAA